MDKVVWIYIGCFVGFFVLLYVKAYFDRKQRKKIFYWKIKENWGKASDREYTFEAMDKLTHYFYLKEHEEFVIDDITWHDLDMDRVFRQMNQTHSSIGEEYLYNLLRTPCFDEKELKIRDAIITYLTEDEEKRMQIQEIFGNIGRTRNVSVIGYLTQFEELHVRNPLRYVAHQAALILAVVSLFVYPPLGIALIIGALGWNVSSYYKEKREIDVYLEAFTYICNVLNKAYLFENIDSGLLEPYAARIVKKAEALKNFRKGRFLLKAGGDLSGGLEDIIMDYARILLHVDLQQFNKMLQELFIHKEELMSLYEDMGYLESMISIASYRKFLGTYAVPEFNHEQQKSYIDARKMVHPLIENAVSNSVSTQRGVLLTGSNASGKSTFLKTMAINCILAQTIYTTAAEYFAMPMGRVYSSMALQDNLEGEESYYIVEIKSLKRIMDASRINEEKMGHPQDVSWKNSAVICFVDEVLRGTNTVERIAASSEILNSLAEKDIYCFAATHDIELTYLLEEKYDNHHFSEQVTDGEVLFDYQLRKGRATSRNAIKLLEVMGYEPEIIRRAQARAKHFMESNDWKM